MHVKIRKAKKVLVVLPERNRSLGKLLWKGD
jgi:hypothetical protein